MRPNWSRCGVGVIGWYDKRGEFRQRLARSLGIVLVLASPQRTFCVFFCTPSSFTLFWSALFSSGFDNNETDNRLFSGSLLFPGGNKFDNGILTCRFRG
jgi:hypothetical protein